VIGDVGGVERRWCRFGLGNPGGLLPLAHFGNELEPNVDICDVGGQFTGGFWLV